MLKPNFLNSDYWCPQSERLPAGTAAPALGPTPADWAALSRFSRGEWISNSQIERLQSFTLIERVFGQPLLTRLGRTTIGVR